ncbi:hypothetical protein [Actinomadura gamaensis]|uniref:ABC transmembrane type-1 domain-containing protein n=1 Tax=Actinomadura gamaensis TaxID=1763541 RepID=A0ABV9U999_9ACTN
MTTPRVSPTVAGDARASGASRPPAALGGRRPAALGRWLLRLLAGWLPALPLLVFTLGMLVLPALRLVHDTFALRSGGFGMDNIQKVADNPVDREAIANSLELGALQATLAAALGMPAAWLISRMRVAGRATWLALMNVASNFAGIGLAFGFVALIGTTGMLTHLLDVSFPATGSFTGMNIAYLYFNIPMFVLLTLPAVAVLKEDWWEAAQVCHATRWQFWRRIGAPVLAPFAAAGWLLIFTWTIGIYAVAYALASGPQSVKLITLQIGATLESSVFGLERAAVLSVLLMLLAVVSTVLYRLAIRRATRWL